MKKIRRKLGVLINKLAKLVYGKPDLIRMSLMSKSLQIVPIMYHMDNIEYTRYRSVHGDDHKTFNKIVLAKLMQSVDFYKSVETEFRHGVVRFKLNVLCRDGE